MAKDIILLAGMWFDANAWDDVVPELRAYGHRPIALELPGVADRDPNATLEDQIITVLAAVDDVGPAVVVGHSAACGLAWIAADRRPEAVERVVLVGGFPNADGETYFDAFEIVDGVMPFPGWAPFEGPDAADLDEATRARAAAKAVPVPAGVTKATVRLTDKRRYGVPVTLVCPEFSPDEAKSAIQDGHVPELAAAEHVSFLDLDSGHWPMFSKPAEFARVLHEAATES